MKKLLAYAVYLIAALSVMAQDGVYTTRNWELTVYGTNATLITHDKKVIKMRMVKPGVYKGGGFWDGKYTAKWIEKGLLGKSYYVVSKK